MTANGYENLQTELKKLLNEDRPNIIEAIAEARSHGDLSENAEYQYAKEQQSLIEGKIADLESAISRAEVIDIKSLEGDDIKFGATVKIEDDDSGEIVTYQIVGEYESDIKNNKLSVSRPLARGLINKAVDDVVDINSPKGQKSYIIKYFLIFKIFIMQYVFNTFANCIINIIQNNIK